MRPRNRSRARDDLRRRDAGAPRDDGARGRGRSAGRRCRRPTARAHRRTRWTDGTGGPRAVDARLPHPTRGRLRGGRAREQEWARRLHRPGHVAVDHRGAAPRAIADRLGWLDAPTDFTRARRLARGVRRRELGAGVHHRPGRGDGREQPGAAGASRGSSRTSPTTSGSVALDSTDPAAVTPRSAPGSRSHARHRRDEVRDHDRDRRRSAPTRGTASTTPFSGSIADGGTSWARTSSPSRTRGRPTRPFPDIDGLAGGVPQPAVGRRPLLGPDVRGTRAGLAAWAWTSTRSSAARRADARGLPSRRPGREPRAGARGRARDARARRPRQADPGHGPGDRGLGAVGRAARRREHREGRASGSSRRGRAARDRRDVRPGPGLRPRHAGRLAGRERTPTASTSTRSSTELAEAGHPVVRIARRGPDRHRRRVRPLGGRDGGRGHRARHRPVRRAERQESKENTAGASSSASSRAASSGQPGRADRARRGRSRSTATRRSASRRRRDGGRRDAPARRAASGRTGYLRRSRRSSHRRPARDARLARIRAAPSRPHAARRRPPATVRGSSTRPGSCTRAAPRRAGSSS